MRVRNAAGWWPLLPFSGWRRWPKGPVAVAFFALIVVAFAVMRRGLAADRTHAVVAGHRDVLCTNATLVRRRPTPQPRVFPHFYSGTQSGALRDQPLPPPAAILVFPAGRPDSGCSRGPSSPLWQWPKRYGAGKRRAARFSDGEDALDIFLLLWLVLPIVLFSFSQSKLPGYIVPALPAGPILVAGFVRRRISSNQTIGRAAVLLHALFAGILVMPCFLITYIVLVHRLPWGVGTLAAGVLSLALTVTIFTIVRGRFGLRLLHFSTLIPVVLSVAALIRMGGVALDEENSTRPVAVALARAEAVTSRLPIAVLQVPRQTEYGLAFYRNQIVASYDRGEIPEGAHLLVAKEGAQSDLAKVVGSRVVELIGSNPVQHLEFYRISGVAR